MTTKTTRPGGRSARVRRAVLDAATTFLDEGRTQVSLPEVATRASVSPSSLYRRWGTWENLVADALLRQSRAAVPVPDTGDVRTDLIAFAESLADFLTSRRGRAVLRATAALEWTDARAAARTHFWDKRFALAGVIVERAIERGELDPSTDPRLLLELVIAPLHLRTLMLGQDPHTAIEQQVDLLLDGTRRTP